MNIIITGAPGSGKGTQSELIEKKFKITKISTGDIIRNEIKKKSSIGEKIKHEQQKGLLIKDTIILTLIKKIIKNKSHILFDGFPRTLGQAHFLSINNIKIDYIINITIKKNIILKRLKYRLLDKKSKKIYNLIYNKPKIKNIDDYTGTNLTTRLDDKHGVIKTRLLDYYKNIKNIINYYKNQSNAKIIKIDGNNKINNIFKKIIKNII